MRISIVGPLTVTAALLAPATASAAFAHVVVAGESLSSVAAADGLSVDQLAAANGITPDAQLLVGSTLQIPPTSAGAAATVSASASASTVTAGDGDADSDDAASAATGGPVAVSTGGSGSAGYTVQLGDTLSAIAARAGTTVADLAAANGIDPNAALLSGTVLTLSSAAAPASAAASTSAAQAPIGVAAAGSPSDPPYPTAETVTASQVGSIANANGVSPSLAAAIGWQESGFNNDLVSSADARGVMQILPGTWDWIQRTLTAGAPLAPASAADNVRGGVLMLRSLLSSSGGDPALAAAGYYQGLASVRQNGVFPSTQQYVNGVMALRQRFGGP